MRDLLSDLPALAGKGFAGPELIVDCFAGGGGASTGIYLALGRHPDIAVNHDAEALAMHRANHPSTLHVSKNIYQVDPMDLCHNRPVGLLWATRLQALFQGEGRAAGQAQYSRPCLDCCHLGKACQAACYHS